MCENEIDVGRNPQKAYNFYFNKNNPRSVRDFLNPQGNSKIHWKN